MSFGDVIRSAASPSSLPFGIGGDANTIWHGDTVVDRVYELSTVDFSVIRSAAAPTNAGGIGGDANTIWHCYSVGPSDALHELSTVDFSVIRSAAPPYSYPEGIGGDANTIWHSDIYSDKIYELDTADFSVIRSAASPRSYPYGVGGDANYIWHCNYNPNTIYELSTVDFSVIRSAASPTGGSAYGIGGDANTIWHCNNEPDKIYELDAETTKTVSGTITSRSGIPLSGATVTIDGNTDTTDAAGQYSITIAPGTYTITAEYSLFKTAAQTLAVSADMTQDLTMYKVESMRKFTGRGASLEGGIGCGMGKRRK